MDYFESTKDESEEIYEQNHSNVPRTDMKVEVGGNAGKGFFFFVLLLSSS